MTGDWGKETAKPALSLPKGRQVRGLCQRAIPGSVTRITVSLGFDETRLTTPGYSDSIKMVLLK